MTNLVPTLILTALVTVAWTMPAEAIRHMYFRNNGSVPGHVWVNGQYQGAVPADAKIYFASHLGLRVQESASGTATKQPPGGVSGGWQTQGDELVVEVRAESADGQCIGQRIPIKENRHWAAVWFSDGKGTDQDEDDDDTDTNANLAIQSTELESSIKLNHAGARPDLEFCQGGIIADHTPQDGVADLINSIGMVLVWLPKDGDNGGYWAGKYEVTQSDYHQVTGEDHANRFEGEHHPVEGVSWYDAQDYVKKLTKMDADAEKLPPGYWYALPTEKQWEYYVADATLGQAVHQALSTEEVGSKEPNRFGLHDVRGNVWEWTLGERDRGKVLRGASWDINREEYLDLSYRRARVPDGRYADYGFRVVLVNRDSSL